MKKMNNRKFYEFKKGDNLEKQVSKENFTNKEINMPSEIFNNSTEEQDNKFNKIYLGYNERLLMNISIILVLMILGIILFISSVSVKTKSNIAYSQTGNLDYKVYLKENDYYTESYLEENMQYISSLIDDVDVDFKYNFNANENINYKYTYYVQGNLVVANDEDKSKIIYSKTEKLSSPKTITKTSSNGFAINEKVKVDYEKYNNLAKQFKSSYAINADSNLELSLIINIEDEKGNIIKSLDKDDMKLIIPLAQQIIDIKTSLKGINNSDNVSVYKDFNISNKIVFSLSIISLVISLVFIVRLLLFLNKTKAKKTIYDITLAKILREYDRVIVNSKRVVDLNSEVIDVNSFNELLDVRDNIEKPIIFSEIHKGQKSIFIVKTANETYRYILKLADLENK